MEGNLNQMNRQLSPVRVDQVLLVQVSKEIVTLLPRNVLLCYCVPGRIQRKPGPFHAPQSMR